MKLSHNSVAHQNDVMFKPPSKTPQRIANYAILMGLAGIIAAILYPVFAQAPSGSRRSCVSSEKQIGTALLMYAQDYDETFPCGARSNRQSSQIVKDTPRQAKYHAGQAWAGGVYPYIKNVMAFLCPDLERQMRQDAQQPYKATQPLHKTIGYGTSQTLLFPVSYFYNRNIALDTKSSTFAAPADTVMLGEVAAGFANIREADERNPENTYSSAGNGLTILASTDGAIETQASGSVHYATGAMGGYGRDSGCSMWPFYASQITPRHGGGSAKLQGSVYLMADGHAKFFKPEQVSPGDDAASSKEAQDCAHYRAAGTSQMKDFAVTFSVR